MGRGVNPHGAPRANDHEPPAGSSATGPAATRGDVMKYLKYLLVLVAVALGVAGVVLGEADDSPGLQLLGVVLVVGAIAFGVRTVRRGR